MSSSEILALKDIKMIKADDIVSHPEMVDDLPGRFRTIWGFSMKGGANNDVERAMNIMALKGWRPTAITTEVVPNWQYIFVIMEKI